MVSGGAAIVRVPEGRVRRRVFPARSPRAGEVPSPAVLAAEKEAKEPSAR